MYQAIVLHGSEMRTLFLTKKTDLTQHPIQWVWGTISPTLKRPGREADHLPPSSVEVKNGGTIPTLPHMLSWHSA
jgi:hypothetical protein